MFQNLSQRLQDTFDQLGRVGEVVAAGHRVDGGAPLIYFNRRYHELQPQKEEL